MVDDFPEALAIKVELIPLLFPLHMLAGGLALVLVPLAILLRHRPEWHRRVARVTAVVVLVAGVTAFPVALVAPVTLGSALGFTAQGALWLVLLAAGIRHIRAGRVAQHGQRICVEPRRVGLVDGRQPAGRVARQPVGQLRVAAHAGNSRCQVRSPHR